MKIVIDMNLSPSWVPKLKKRGALITLDENKGRVRILPI